MSKFLDKIDYDVLVEKSLKGVVIDALKIVEQQGLPGDNHFYITFKTGHQRTEVDKLIKEQYPNEMTIIIQHQYSGLEVKADGFFITLSFSNIPCPMFIPYDAITYFGDPSSQFGLSFGSEIDSYSPQAQKKEPRNADIVSIDAFRKKGNA